MVQVGDWHIQSVVTGSIRLDGGAMFGVVPKTLWSKTQDVDDQNRILLATRTLLAVDRARGRIVLVDTGSGSKWDAKQATRYCVDYDTQAIDDALHELGVGAADVTDVVAPHLHFDHAGGMTEWADQPGGPIRLRFPGANHWVHRRHWEYAHNPSVRDRASFFPDNFVPLADAGVASLVEGDSPWCPIDRMQWWLSHGHTPYQMLPLFESGDDSRDVLFVGDLIPTAAHLPLAWNMAYDLLPLVVVSERQEVYRRCREEGLALAFPHDPHNGMVVLEFDRDKPKVKETLG